jgi:hypothetical protein
LPYPTTRFDSPLIALGKKFNNPIEKEKPNHHCHN